jgi:hypothetical protein
MSEDKKDETNESAPGLKEDAFMFDLWFIGNRPVHIGGRKLPPYEKGQDRKWPNQ